MQLFLCWVPDRGQTADDALVAEAPHKHKAAEKFAHDFWNRQNPDFFKELTVRVRAPDMSEWDIEVEVIPEPTFQAYGVAVPVKSIGPETEFEVQIDDGL